MGTILRLDHYAYAYPNTDRFILKDVDFGLGAGECHCVMGATGSGKTTLALAIKGLLPAGTVKGEIHFTPSGARANDGIGIILQNPETQLLTATVGAETAFGLENLGVAPASMRPMVETALASTGLEKSLDFPVGKLSMGQKYRLLLASHMATHPALLILDEPTGQLDPDGLKNLLAILQALKKAGCTLVLFDNHPEHLAPAVDAFWHLTDDGALRPGPGAPPPGGDLHRSIRAASNRAPFRTEAIAVRNVTVAGDGDQPIWSDASFAVMQGQRVAVCGRNGSGKTTLLRCLAGLTRPKDGEIAVFGQRPSPRHLRGKVGYLIQNPQRQLFEETVFQEVSFALTRRNGNGTGAASGVNDILSQCGIDNLSGASPHKLSYGQKHLVALASVLASAPDLLFLDDPFVGLDAARCEIVLDLLTTLNEEHGTTIVWTSHDPDMLPGWSHATLHIRGGAIDVR